MKNIWPWCKDKLQAIYYWIRSLFITRYTIHVSYDQHWGNDDDQIYYDVKSISKQNFKELKFIDHEGNAVVHRSASGLKYKIKEM
jgi:hypothetical protein